jgi:predicted MFS family arabinose efflux permease
MTTVPQLEARADDRLDGRLWLLSLGSFAIGTDAFSMAGILPLIAEDLGVSVPQAGQVISAYALVYAVGAPILAALTARFRREQMALAALAAFVVADVLSAMAPGYLPLLVVRIVAGACAATYTPSAYGTSTGIAPPHRRGAALTVVALGVTSSAIFGVPLGTLIGQSFGWRATFALNAMLAAIGVVALFLARLPPVEPGPAMSLRERFAPIVRPRVITVMMPTFLRCTASYVVYTYSAVVFAVLVPKVNIAYLLLAYGCGGLIGSQLGGRAVDRFGWLPPIAFCAVLSIVNFVSFDIAATGLAGAIVVSAGLGFCGWGSYAAEQTRLLRVEPDHPNIMLSLASSTVYFGSALGAALGAVLLTRYTPTALPVAGVVLASLGATVFAVSLRYVKLPP